MQSFHNFNFKGKKALVRVDFNVPLDKTTKSVTDVTRISASLPTIKKILNDGGAVILMSHLGRPDGVINPDFSLNHILGTLNQLIGQEVEFATDCIGEDALIKSQNLKEGKILLLENLRFHKEEEEGDLKFAQKLSKLGDVYVNDAFGTAHRSHASTAVIAQFFGDKLFGILMAAEVESLEKVLKSAEKPFTAIIGGSKVSDKVGVIANLLDKADNVLIGGAMAYTFKKAMGGQVGKSRIEADKLDLAREIIQKAKDKGVNIYLPEDSIVASEFKEDAAIQTQQSDRIDDEQMGLDIGTKAIDAYNEVIMKSKTILWNGPMGVFEWTAFENGTKQVALSVANATQQNGAYSLIGGGDSVSAINKFNLQNQVSYISTGGGAMLEYLEGKVLPGVAAIL
jgi:phosphoglycerate kinase